MTDFYPLEFADEKGYARELKKLHRQAGLLVHTAVTQLLAAEGPNLAATDWAKGLGKGLWEFRIGPTTTAVVSTLGQNHEIEIAHQKLLFRVFFAVTNHGILIVLSSYNKGRDPSHRRQQREIQEARKILKEFVPKKST